MGRDRRILSLTIAFVVVLVVGSSALLIRQLSSPRQIKEVAISDAVVHVHVADTPSSRAQGLSGTPPLSTGQGLLLDFKTSGPQGIWMKDMSYPLDLIWLDIEGRVVHIEKNVSPDSYPQVFSSPHPARYVLEARAGFAQRHEVVEGTMATFAR